MSDDTLFEPKIVLKVDDDELHKLTAAESRAKQSGETIKNSLKDSAPSFKSISDSIGGISGMMLRLPLGLAAAIPVASTLADKFTKTTQQIAALNLQLRETEARTKAIYAVSSATTIFQGQSRVTQAGFRSAAALSYAPSFMRPEAEYAGQERIGRIGFKNAQTQLKMSMKDRLQQMNDSGGPSLEEYRKAHTTYRDVFGAPDAGLRGDASPWATFVAAGGVIADTIRHTAGQAVPTGRVDAAFSESEHARKKDNARFIKLQEDATKKELDEIEKERSRASLAAMRAAVRQRSRDTVFANVMSQFDTHRQGQLAGHNVLGASLTDMFKSTTGNVVNALGQGHFREAWNATKTGISKAMMTSREYRFGEDQELKSLQSDQRIAELSAKNGLFGENNLAIEMEKVNEGLRPAIDEQKKIFAEATDNLTREYAKQKLTALEATKTMQEAEVQKNERIRQLQIAMGTSFVHWESGTMSADYGNLSVMNPLTGGFEKSEELNSSQMTSYLSQLNRSNETIAHNTRQKHVPSGRGRRY